MKKISLFILSIFWLSLCTKAIAKELVGKEAQQLIANASKILLNDDGTYKFITFADSAQPREAERDEVLKSVFLAQSPFLSFKLIRIEKDDIGFTHYTYQQYYADIKVTHGTLKLHCKNQKVVSINGEYYISTQKPEIVPLGNFTRNAISFLKEKDGEVDSVSIKKMETVYFRSKDGLWVLCDKVLAVAQYEKPLKYVFYISTKDGSKVFEENQILHTNVTGTAATKYCGIVSITTDSTGPSNYRLRENGTRVINTYNMGSGTNTVTATDFIDTDNNWNTDSAVYDAHYGAEKTWDYYQNILNRNSYDNAGSPINSYTHYGSYYVNAFWDAIDLYMAYGDGNGTTYGPLTSTDVVGHEITHAVTQFSADLAYQFEPGALNESFSDIIGIAIDFYANPSTANFLMGDEFALGSSVPFRNIENPNLTNQPDTYHGTYWEFGFADYGGVHTNSQVQNYWYYLLCNGGSGTNDIGNSYTVNAIGMADATKIAYRTLNVYLYSNSQYADARTYSIQSAIDLFGSCSQQVIEVTNAWHAVGVGSRFANLVTANFTANPTITCGTSATINFTSTSLNATTYNWDFGDGTTSTAQNPSHTYAAAGIYNVRLIVTGTAPCGGSVDTVVKPAFISIINNPMPIPSTCLPILVSTSPNYGILNVQVNTINNSSSVAIEGYKDFTCTQQTTLSPSSQYMLKITTQYQYEKTTAFIDYNNDGVFSTLELLPTFSSSSNVRQIIFSIPSAGVTYNTPLRLRIISDLNPITSACPILNYGQAEDYTVIISNIGVASPLANYYVVDTVVGAGTSSIFTDLSANGPTNWSWTFSGGIPNSSTAQNPTVLFNAAGVYPVKLVASNAYGTDSITRNIHVTDSFKLCSPTSTQTITTTSGLLYDSGGPFGNYQNGENCSLLISPGVCTDSIKLTFTSCVTEQFGDYLSVYDGATTTSPVLWLGSGSGLPPALTATSGNMLINFTTSAMGNYSGFEASWTTFQSLNITPTASFSFAPSTPAVLDTILFTNTSSANAVAWHWDFGDGGISTLQNPTHQYSTAGTYIVTLISSACGGASDTMTNIITTQGSPNVVFSNTSFSVNLGCSDTVNLQVLLQNNGLGTLNWHIGSPLAGTVNNKVLAWTYGVDLSAVGEFNSTIAAINQYYTNYVLSTSAATTDSSLEADLIGKSVLLIPEIETGSAVVVSSCSTAIKNFVQNGGTVIYCGDGNTHTPINTGIFSGGYGSSIYGASIPVINNSTPITANVYPPVAATSSTHSYSFTNANRITLLPGQTSGTEVVTIMNYGLGTAIFIGFDYNMYDSNSAKIISNAVGYAIQNSTKLAGAFVTPSNGTVSSGSIDTITIHVNSRGLQGGIDTSFVIVNTNDPANLQDTIWIYKNISNMPCANFGNTTPSLCAGVVNFTDSTTNNPFLWHWDFGDGSTSTLQNPTHVFTANGTFSVTLIATSIAGTDSISKTVTINNAAGPLGAFCSPSVLSSVGTSYGIMNVQLNTINNSSSIAASEGYADFTCTQQTTLVSGTQYLLKVTTLYQFEKTIAWIDYNNDGAFSNTEALPTFASGNNVRQIILNIPSTGVSYNTPLRLRIISDLINYTTPCPILSSGQAEDYTVIISNTNSASPIANYYVVDTLVSVGSFRTFSDLSANGPTSWNWTIPGGSPSSSTAQNPSVLFSTAGVYPVKLTASNAFGIDSITKNIYVGSTFNLCSPSSTLTTTASFGLIYDSGGGSGNYQTNQNCSLLINPGTCFDSIKLTFTSFQTESGYDFLYVYDGASTASPLLWSGSGSTLPPTLTATSGKMFIKFTSDVSWNLAGFAASWTAFHSVTASPIANFSFMPVTPAVLDTVVFSNNSSLDVIAWSWNFGDGATSNLQNPTHQYSTAGTYTVTLIVSSCIGTTDTTTTIITTQGNPSVMYGPSSFSVNLGCNDTANLQVLIHNLGAGSLNWNIGTSISGAGNSNVLAWTYGTDLTVAGEYYKTIAAINQYYANYTLHTSTATTSAALLADLNGKNVLLIPKKETGSTAVISACSVAIQSFVQNGGIVIYCGDNIFNTVINTGIFNGSYASNLASTNITIVNNTTPLTVNVGSSFTASNATHSYNFTNTNKTTLVSGAGGKEVVTILPYGLGKAIFIAFDYNSYDSNAAKIISNAVNYAIQSSVMPGGAFVTPSNGTVNSNNTDTAYLQVNSNGISGGIDTSFVILNTNDPNNLHDTIWIYKNIPNTPCANFGNTIPTLCTGVVNFTDSTTNNPISWYWNFGDGYTSTMQNPTHIYTSSGTFTVTLIATSITGSDSVSKIVLINNIGGPIAAACNPIVLPTFTTYGIKTVQLNSINHSSSNATEGYKDFTCTQQTTLFASSQYVLKVTTYYQFDKTLAWIDYNNDGVFSSSEALPPFASTSAARQVIFSIPSTGVVYNTPLRLRIISDLFTYASPCPTLSYGQGEDYTVIISNASTVSPAANYYVVDTIVRIGDTVKFFDISTNGPTNWNWTIPGGSLSSSTAQNPSVAFNTAGVYPVKLVVSNAFGSDSITRNIHVFNSFTLCNPSGAQIVTATSGLIYDSGGPTSNYSNNENCSVLINPGICTDSIKLTFSSFQAESGYDFLFVYNGSSSASPLLWSGSGSVLPPTLTATSGKMFIKFSTNSVNNNGGFAASWLAFQSTSPSPTANFTYAPAIPAIFDTVYFTNTSSANAVIWLWDFGDGATSNLQNPTHQYSTAGTYTVTLITTSCGGGSDTITNTITTQGNPSVVYSANSFSVNLGCRDTANLQVLLQNNGTGVLNWHSGNTSLAGVGGNNMLAWTYGVDLTLTGEYNNTIAAINQYYTNYALSTSAAATNATLEGDLIGKDVLLIPEKETGSIPVITACSTAIQNFVQKGGTVIYCGDLNKKTAISTGIFSGNYAANITGTNITVVNNNSPITANVISPVLGSNATYCYSFTNTNKTTLLSGASGNEVLTVLPYGLGKAMFIAFDYNSYDSNAAKIISNAVKYAIQNSVMQGGAIAVPNSGTASPGTADTVNIQVNSNGLMGGLDTSYIILNTNDPNNLQDTIWVYKNVSYMPCANFSTSAPTLCSSYVSFTDSTTNNPNSWYWNFGDGNISTLQNPTHVYTNNGTFTVTLVATNNTGTDSISKTVTILNTGGPISTACTMSTGTKCCNNGISNFNFAGINHSSLSDVEGFQDFTCATYAIVTKGASYPFYITGTTTGQWFHVYLDFNNDGTFSSNENLISNSYSTNGYLSGNVTIPNNSILYTTLRMRVIASASPISLCSTIDNGQAEDYSIIVRDSIPTADFTATPTTAWVNEIVQFTDISTSNITAWNWQMPGASTPTSTINNPSTSYPVAGTYDVTLIANNLAGADTIVRSNYINVLNLPSTSFTYFDPNCSGNVNFAAQLPAPYTSATWDFGDGSGQTVSSSLISHTYTNQGTYTVSLIAISPYGNDTFTAIVNVSFWNASIQIFGIAAPNSPITFSVQSSNPIASAIWDFGDNIGNSFLKNPVYTYSSTGTYTVSVSVIDTHGCSKELLYILTINPLALTSTGAHTDVNVYPNPFNNTLNIAFDNIKYANELSVQIFTATGQKVYAMKKEKLSLDKLNIPVSKTLAKGVYFVEVNVDGNKFTKKVTKE
ncbi:MAG: hypothetical protein RL660_1156 [Bacteroidota bacterium]|jgi:PKD repeat protein